MQALPSNTASGEHFLSVLPPAAATATPGSPGLVPSLQVSDFDGAPLACCFDPDSPLNLRTKGRPKALEAEVRPSIADGLGLAHDAGNLLGAIRLYCDLLALPGVLRNEHRHYAEELRQLTARSGSLIDRLLRPATPLGMQEATPRIRPDVAVRECRSMLSTVAQPESLLIAVEAGAHGEVAVPREALERILVNLIKNAREAGGCAEEQGTITVRVRSVPASGPDWRPEGGAGIAISVEDCGQGMDEASVRAALSGTSSGMPERPGRGLGLRVVRELAGSTGGELRMRSRIGHGTAVEIVWAALAPEGAESG